MEVMEDVSMAIFYIDFSEFSFQFSDLLFNIILLRVMIQRVH